MDKKEAYKIVFEDIMATDIGLFKGRYDAANGMSEYMNGVWLVMEYITNHISEECCDTFNDMFAKTWLSVRSMRRMNKYLKHFITVSKHKKEVLKECWACGLIWQGIVHDMSKFGITEFVSSARYFQGTRSPIEAEKEELGYSAAWLHHKGHNKHHWEYWTDFNDDGTIKCAKIPYKYVVEMVCDWIGAGKVYSKNQWSQKSPQEYYYKVRAGRHFHPRTEALLITLLDTIAEEGLDKFHSMVKSDNLQNYYKELP